MLKIALLGALRTGTSALASGLESAAKAGVWPVIITLVKETPAPALSGCALVLLAGLHELSEPPGDSCQTATTCRHAQQAADSAIRAALAGAAIPYQVLYGRPDERLAQACAAIESLLRPPTWQPHPPADAPSQLRGLSKPWVWSCDKCSDPQCEHRLLTGLLARRASAA